MALVPPAVVADHDGPSRLEALVEGLEQSDLVLEREAIWDLTRTFFQCQQGNIRKYLKIFLKKRQLAKIVCFSIFSA